MKVYANIRQEVEVDPKDVIQNLINTAIGIGWIFEKEGKFYKGFEIGTSHSFNDEIEINICTDRLYYERTHWLDLSLLTTKERALNLAHEVNNHVASSRNYHESGKTFINENKHIL